jgi:PAS domain-containing protein
VLDHLGEGVAMFDSQQRLVAWNQHMIELSGADAALARPGVSLREMMQEMASRGEFGELGAEAAAARRKAVTALPGAQSVRRVRPDGRVVERDAPTCPTAASRWWPSTSPRAAPLGSPISGTNARCSCFCRIRNRRLVRRQRAAHHRRQPAMCSCWASSAAS